MTMFDQNECNESQLTFPCSARWVLVGFHAATAHRRATNAKWGQKMDPSDCRQQFQITFIFMMKNRAWRDYQEEAAEFFRELGLEAETDARVEGVRTAHDVDVLVTFNHAGLSLKWLVECKHWKRRVSKLHVLGLREIVSDVGADRGILLAEKGFQRGSSEAAVKSNVSLTSLADLRQTASDALNQQRLNAFPRRLAEAHISYWSISKSDRIDLGIRHDIGDVGFHGGIVLMIAQDVLLSSLAGKFPPYGNSAFALGADQITNLEEGLNWLESQLSELEKKLGTPETAARRRGDYLAGETPA
ncbi:restriction endonuclease [Pseudarthrobacter quantipunctorum]|uniref:Restriction endonuclease n=1 Tax=Pseudarthrobacter quantipunctorum TaxID=3128980 RepID=A0ABZ2RF50_9MICC